MRRVMSICVAVSMALLAGFPAGAETVEEIIQKNLEARGGEENWKAVESARMSGTMQMMATEAGGLEAPFSIEFKRPDKVRVEFTMQGMTGIQAYDGETGWMVMPFMGKTEPEEIVGPNLEQIREQGEFDGPLVDYEAKGNTVELLGTEEVDGTPAYKLKVTKANGDVDILYLDQEYYIEFKSVSKREMQGQELEVATVYGDYKEVDGLMIPHSLEVAMGGGPPMQVITLDTVELNADIPNDRFAMPSAEAEAEPAAE